MQNTHEIVSVHAKPASGPGALSGHEALCSCGFRMATSIGGPAEAARQGAEHVAYMARAASPRKRRSS